MPGIGIPIVSLYPLRAARGWTQDTLAARAGLSRQCINRLETGVTDPRAATIQKLARALRVAPITLLV